MQTSTKNQDSQQVIVVNMFSTLETYTVDIDYTQQRIMSIALKFFFANYAL